MITDTLSPKEALSKYFGFSHFKGEQEQVIESILAGHHIFVIMTTGAGKSLCYKLPVLIRSGTGIFYYTLIAIMNNQVDTIRTISEKDGVGLLLNSSLFKEEVQRIIDDVNSGVTKLL